MTRRLEKVMQTSLVAKHVAIFMAAALALSSSITAQSGHELFQQALSKERAEGKLQDAIALYQRVIEVAGADHALAARALLQLGRCYETLGHAEARSAYERLIARYPDQSDLVAQAKTRLAALVRTPTATPAAAAMTVRTLPEIGKDGELLAVNLDGTKAIVMNYSKGQNIALFDVAKKQTRLLTDLDWQMGWIYYAAWSPDARQVAYMYARLKDSSFELHTTTLDGRSSVMYRNDGGGPVLPVGWTPDGTTLVALVARPDRTWAVGTIPASGGRLHPCGPLAGPTRRHDCRLMVDSSPTTTVHKGRGMSTSSVSTDVTRSESRRIQPMTARRPGRPIAGISLSRAIVLGPNRYGQSSLGTASPSGSP
jgi:hypothetical protein